MTCCFGDPRKPWPVAMALRATRWDENAGCGQAPQFVQISGESLAESPPQGRALPHHAGGVPAQEVFVIGQAEGSYRI